MKIRTKKNRILQSFIVLLSLLVLGIPFLAKPVTANAKEQEDTLTYVGSLIVPGMEVKIEEESAKSLFDNDQDTKWCLIPSNDELGTAFAPDYLGAVIFKTPETSYATEYTFTIAGDTYLFPSRNPVEWKLYGGHTETGCFHLLDSRKNQTLKTEEYYKATFSIPEDNRDYYEFYKLVIMKTGEPETIYETNIFQLAEVSMTIDTKNDYCEQGKHKWVLEEGEVDREPECTTTGSGVFCCANCGKMELCDIDPIGHKNIYYEPTPPTCTTDGGAIFECERCRGHFLHEDDIEQTSEIIIVPKVAHHYIDYITKATFDIAGNICTECEECGKPYGEPVIIPMATATLPIRPYIYNGEVQIPEITLTGVSKNDCKITWDGDCKEPGRYTATVEIVKGDRYEGETNVQFSIDPCEHETVTEDYIVQQKASFTKDGIKQKECTFCHTPMGTETVKIPKAKVSLSKTSYTYNGKTQKPTVKVTGAAASEYSLSKWTGNQKNVGTYTAKLTLKGEQYEGTKTLTYKINPKGTTIKTPAAAKKAFTAKWTKQAAKMATTRITGYELQYATNSKFTTGKKTVKIKGYKTVYKKISKLKAKKKYYLRIRTYLTTGGKTYYSGWSKTKTVTTK